MKIMTSKVITSIYIAKNKGRVGDERNMLILLTSPSLCNF